MMRHSGIHSCEAHRRIGTVGNVIASPIYRQADHMAFVKKITCMHVAHKVVWTTRSCVLRTVARHKYRRATYMLCRWSHSLRFPLMTVARWWCGARRPMPNGACTHPSRECRRCVQATTTMCAHVDKDSAKSRNKTSITGLGPSKLSVCTPHARCHGFSLASVESSERSCKR